MIESTDKRFLTQTHAQIVEDPEILEFLWGDGEERVHECISTDFIVPVNRRSIRAERFDAPISSKDHVISIARRLLTISLPLSQVEIQDLQ